MKMLVAGIGPGQVVGDLLQRADADVLFVAGAVLEEVAVLLLESLLVIGLGVWVARGIIRSVGEAVIAEEDEDLLSHLDREVILDLGVAALVALVGLPGSKAVAFPRKVDDELAGVNFLPELLHERQ